MTVRLFEGPAGSGKTTRLFQAVAEHLAGRPLQRDERVLALTKMHGSRRRMQGKLLEVLGTDTTSDCSTLNSFTHGLVHRWRTLAGTIRDPLPDETDFPGVSDLAAQLLARDSVVRWVAARHPLLVVDELQDLRGPELAVVKGLARGLDVLCAADEFQDLDPQGVCEGVAWARDAGDVVRLDHVHRTNVAALLAAARSVRGGEAPVQGSGFKRFPAANPRVAASFMARNLTWAGTASVAILSPVGPGKAKFVRDALERLSEKPFVKNDESFGPFRVPWTSAAADELQRWADLLDLHDETRGLVAAAEILALERQLPGPLVDWVQARRRLAGEEAFTPRRVVEQLGRAQAQVRGHTGQPSARRVGLTVNSAKNREFDHVIVLWPVNVKADLEWQRRRLYNAITRAKRSCVVIVQDPAPQASRLHQPPFA